jgi:TRAP-type C4-dicarboxylate transport system permease small subunit
MGKLTGNVPTVAHRLQTNENLDWLHRVRNGLDALYLISGCLAAACLVGILLMTMLQIGARLTGHSLRGASDYAGYFMAGAAFFGFPYALNQGAQIRIELFLSMMGRRRPLIERLGFVVSSVIAIWFAYHCWGLVSWSYELGDVSQGLDATPIWIPQLTMAIGVSLMAVSVVDRTLRLFITGNHGLPQSPDSL